MNWRKRTVGFIKCVSHRRGGGARVKRVLPFTKPQGEGAYYIQGKLNNRVPWVNSENFRTDPWGRILHYIRISPPPKKKREKKISWNHI